MKDIELVIGHKVNHRLHRFFAEEMAAFIQKHAAPAERRRIRNLDARKCQQAVFVRRKLTERLLGVEATCGVGGAHYDTFLRNGYTVSFLGK